MKKYNLSKIMKAAWNFYRKFNATCKTGWTFALCLKKAWVEAKEAIDAAVEAAKTGLRRMHYSEYKNNYSECETVPGSYDKRTKTIEVMTKRFKHIHASNGLCPYCHTYCYGDCRAH